MVEWLTKTRLFIWIMRTFVSSLKLRIFGYPLFPMAEYFVIRKMMIDRLKQDPTTMFTFVGVDTCAMSFKINKLITGAYFAHAGFAKIEDGEIYIYHIIGTGRERWSLLDYLREVDAFSIGTVPFISPAHCAQAWKRFYKLLDCTRVKYDFQFTLSEDIIPWLDSEEVDPDKDILLYCSDFDYVVLANLVDKLVAHWKSGRKTFEPDDVFFGVDPLYVRRLR